MIEEAGKVCIIIMMLAFTAYAGVITAHDVWEWKEERKK